MTVWADILHAVAYGGLELDVLTAEDSLQWAVARYSYPRRDGADLDSFGAEPRTTKCKILFFERKALEDEGPNSELTHAERFELFHSIVAQQVPQEFVHPLTGSYRALVEDMQVSINADESDAIEVDCTFVEDSTAPAAFDIAGRPVRAGVAQVEVEADTLNTALEEAGLISTIADDVVETVTGWAEDADATARQVNLELQSLSNRIADSIDELELAVQIDRYPVWRSMQRLHHEVRRAAEAFRQAAPTLFEFTVQAPVPLMTLAAEIYGGEQAEARYDELLKLNDIDDPTLVTPGTRLRANSPDSSPGAGLRSAT